MARIYDSARWQRLRARKLRAQPTCEPCARRGVIRPANTVDHNVAVTAGGPAFPPLDGLTSMCASCHGEKTSAVDRPDRRPGAGLLRGCDLDGRPLDPNDPWLKHGGADFSGASDPSPTDAPNAQVVTSKSRGPGWA